MRHAAKSAQQVMAIGKEQRLPLSAQQGDGPVPQRELRQNHQPPAMKGGQHLLQRICHRLGFSLGKQPVMIHRLPRQGDMQFVDMLFQLPHQRRRTEQGRPRELPSQIEIEIEHPMPKPRQLPCKMLRPLHACVPVRHRQNQHIGFFAGFGHWPGQGQGGELPATLPLRRFRFRMETEIQPLEVKRTEPLFDGMVLRCVGANAFIVGEAGLAR